MLYQKQTSAPDHKGKRPVDRSDYTAADRRRKKINSFAFRFLCNPDIQFRSDRACINQKDAWFSQVYEPLFPRKTSSAAFDEGRLVRMASHSFTIFSTEIPIVPPA